MDIVPSLFDGKVCRKCDKWFPLSSFYKHVRMPDGTRNECKDCVKRYAEENKQHRREWWSIYSVEHKAEKSEYDRKRRETHKDALSEYMRHYYATHKEKWHVVPRRLRKPENSEKLKQQKSRFYQRYRDRHRAKHREYYQSNHETIRHNASRWKAANRLAAYASDARRRNMLISSGGTHTLEQWNALKSDYEFSCLCCGKREPEISLTRDHVIPVSKGGSDNIENIQPLCGPCNSSKSASSTDYRIQR